MGTHNAATSSGFQEFVLHGLSGLLAIMGYWDARDMFGALRCSFLKWVQVGYSVPS
jgi:hypothetical protein